MDCVTGIAQILSYKTRFVTFSPSKPLFILSFFFLWISAVVSVSVQTSRGHSYSVLNLSFSLSKFTRCQFPLILSPICPNLPHLNIPILVKAVVVYFLEYSGFSAFDVSITSLIQTAARVLFTESLSSFKKWGVGGWGRNLQRKWINSRIKFKSYFSWYLGHLKHLSSLPE